MLKPQYTFAVLFLKKPVSGTWVDSATTACWNLTTLMIFEMRTKHLEYNSNNYLS